MFEGLLISAGLDSNKKGKSIKEEDVPSENPSRSANRSSDIIDISDGEESEDAPVQDNYPLESK